MIKVICFLCCNSLLCSPHLSNGKTTHLSIVKLFSRNYSCDQYTHIDNITFKVFSNVYQRSKAHFRVITHWGEVQLLWWTSTNNNRWTSWLFIVLWSDVSQQWWPGVYTGHSHTASRQGEGHEQHLKKPCKRSKDQRKDTYSTATRVIQTAMNI